MTNSRQKHVFEVLITVLILCQPLSSAYSPPSLLSMTPLSSHNSIPYTDASLSSTQEFVINETIRKSQFNPCVSIIDNGDFYVVWQGDSGAYDSIYSRFYELKETATTHNLADLIEWYETELNYLYGTDQKSPVAARVTGNNLAVIWTRDYGSTFGDQILMQIFNKFGETQSNVVAVNSGRDNDNAHPYLAVLSSGNIVVVWVCEECGNDYDLIYGKMFDGDGDQIGESFQVNQGSAESAEKPIVVPLNDGGFLVVWASELDDENDINTYMRRYDADGNSLGIEKQVNENTGKRHSNIRGIQLDKNNIVFVYEAKDKEPDDDKGIFAKVFDADLNEVNTEFNVNSRTNGDQRSPRITNLPDGGFFVAWRGDNDERVIGRRFTSEGAAIGAEITVSERGDEIKSISIASSSEYFIIVWEAEISDLDNVDTIGKLFFLEDR